jgi:hypothetical protein
VEGFDCEVEALGPGKCFFKKFRMQKTDLASAGADVWPWRKWVRCKSVVLSEAHISN